jgi:hypothetical protein
MRLIAVPKARTLAIIEIDALNLEGKVRLADCIAPIVGRYGFLKYPKEPNEFDLDKGVRFEAGKAEDVTIDSLVIYGQAIVLDTLSSTDDSKRIILEMLEWGSQELGLTYSPADTMRWAYISHLIFDTDFPLLQHLSPPLQKLAEKTSAVTNEIFGGLPYEVGAVSVGHDPMIRKNGIASFMIQHRINTRFEENRYFSEAPLPTKVHIQFLTELENDILEVQTDH